VVTIIASGLSTAVALQRSRVETEMSEDNFVVRTSNIYVWVAIIASTVLWATVALLFYVVVYAEPDDLIGWMIFVIALIAITLFSTYLSLYYGLYETRVIGNEICHRELFYRKHTFTFDDVSRVKIKRKVSAEKLGGAPYSKVTDVSATLYSAKDTLLVAEAHYIGYDLLMNRLRQAGVKIEEKF